MVIITALPRPTVAHQTAIGERIIASRQIKGAKLQNQEERTLTGLKPPGGLVLAQLQFGSLHFDASQEYPAASALEVAPVIPPSSLARASRGAMSARRT
jgi:hypothetical protein